MRSWLVLFAFILSVAHFASLAGTTSNPALYCGPILLYGLIRGAVFLRSRRPTGMGGIRRLIPWLKELVILLLITAMVMDLLASIIPFEPHPDVQKHYRILQILVLYSIPALIVFLPYRWRPLLAPFGLLLQLIPPYSYSSVVAFDGPAYGRVTVLLFLVLLFPSTKRVPAGRPPLLLAVLLAAAGLPAIFFGRSPANAVEHVAQISVFFASLLVLLARFQRRSSRDRLLVMLTVVAGLQAAFVLIWPDLHAINSNVTSLLLECFLFVALYLLEGSLRRPVLFWISALAVFGLVLATDYRIDANTGFITAAFAAAGWLGLRFVLARIPAKLRAAAVIVSVALAVMVAMSYMLWFSTSQTVVSRRLLWEAAASDVLASWWHIVFGTGDFGPFHFFLFRNFPRVPTAFDLGIIAREPGLVGQHPHNDYVLMGYGGGLLYVVLYAGIVFLVLRQIARRAKDPFHCALGAALFALLFHAVSEPVTVGVVSGFLFWMMAGWLLREESNRADSARLSGGLVLRRATRQGLATAAGVTALWLIVASGLQMRSTAFWRSNFDLYAKLRLPQSTRLWEAMSERRKESVRQEIPAMMASLQRAEKLLLIETDVYRQEGDLSAILAALEQNSDRAVEDLARSESCYCRAFALKSSPMHYAGIRRAREGRGLTLAGACDEFQRAKFMLQDYDRYGFLNDKAF